MLSTNQKWIETMLASTRRQVAAVNATASGAKRTLTTSTIKSSAKKSK